MKVIINKNELTNCWTINSKRSIKIYIKRLWQEKNGLKPSNMFFQHKCKNIECINPDHIFLNSKFDNNSQKTWDTRRKNGTDKRGGNSSGSLKTWEIRRKNGTDKMKEETKLKISKTKKIISLSTINKNGPIIDIESIQAKKWPEIANTRCWIGTHSRRFYKTYIGEIPENIEVCHKCDNIHGPCINPSHLFLGTHGENIQDCYDKKRRNMTIANLKGWETRSLNKTTSLGAVKGWETRRKKIETVY